MKLDDILIRRMFFLVVIVSLFFAALMQVSSEEKVRYADLEKEEIGEDEESQELLRIYYGEILGKIKKNAKFNNIASHGDLAILNVTIDGRDRRILTRLRTATLFPGQIGYGDSITTINLVVLGNISLKGILFSNVESSFGPRRLFGLQSTRLSYVDEGFSRLVNGEAKVSVNPILRELISSYNVFLSAQGLTQGLYVAEKAGSYFVVKSVNADSNVAFSWMLRGLRADYDEGYLISRHGLEKGISITATIDYENGDTKVKVDGFDKVLALINETSNNTQTTSGNNSAGNETNNTDGSITLITGNLIDEFGLETDLGKILSNSSSLDITEDTTDEISNDSNNNSDNITTNNDDLIINETGAVSNETQTSILEFTILSVDEDFIVSQIASVTGLSSFEVKKLVNFVYAEPAGFSDEVIDLQAKLDFIQKINGSVIIKLG